MDSFRKIIAKIKALFVSAQYFFGKTTKILLESFKRMNTDKKNRLQNNLDRKLVYSLSKSRIPNWRQLKYVKKYLSPIELKIFYASLLVLVVSLSFSGARFYFDHLEIVPKTGGKYTEGAVGMPKYINPLYSTYSDADNDIARLVFSSLFKRDKNGALAYDLAESQEISADGKVYIFSIRPNVYWHNGRELTVDDIVYTFYMIKDGQYKSPLRSSFNGVDIEKEDDRKVKFILSNPYAAFLELLTFGIMPAELWQQIPPESASLAELNLKPIGSGPYRFDKYAKDTSGNIKEYSLVVNEQYYGNKPYVNIAFKFFSSFEEAIGALNDNLVDGISYLPEELQANIIVPKSYNFHKLFLPQLTAVFFNASRNPVLGDKAVRQALALALDKEAIIQNELNGDAQNVDGPILPSSFAYNDQTKKYLYNPEEALKLLEGGGWKKTIVSQEEIEQIKNKAAGQAESEAEKISAEEEKKLAIGAGEWQMKGSDFLSIRLTIVDTVENQKIAEAIKKAWMNLGIKTEISALPTAETQAVIKERGFEALFYGQAIGADPDPYAFWHSSQTGQTGLNIAGFANKEADQLLEDARTINDQETRRVKYARFQEIIAEEAPCIFLYSPIYTYVQDKKIKGFDVKSILLPRERFANVEEWYIETGKKLSW